MTALGRREISILPNINLRWLLTTLVLTLAACEPFPEPKAAPPPPVPVPGELDLTGGARFVAEDLVKQLGPAGTATRSLVIDPFIDGRTGQQTRASQLSEQRFAEALMGLAPGLKVLRFDSAGAAEARLLVSGTLSGLPEAERYRLSIALSDRAAGMVVAQAVAPLRQAGLDASPTRFYTDSPSLVRDRSVEGYLRTAETARGAAADALYIEQVPTAALLANALDEYNAGRWQEALTLYKAAAERPDGQQLRSFNGIYLTNVQLGHETEAEEAFGKIAALGLATNNLAVKLLFRPGTTEFWPDPKVSGVYPMWLRQIARATSTAGVCLNVVGHTSRSGTEAVNERLSLARATTIRARLDREAPGLAARSQVTGVGFRENLVGSGADDASDAVDRRVEFKVVVCAG